MGIIERIENKRIKRGISAYKLCNETGVDKSHYYKWRKGSKNSLSKDKIDRLKKYLKVR